MPSRKQKPLLEKAERAISGGDEQALRELLAQGLDPNGCIEDHKGARTPLLALVGRELYRVGRRDIAQTLIEHGASIRMARDAGCAFLDHSLLCEDLPFIAFVVGHLDTLYHPSEPARYSHRIFEPTTLALMVDKGMERMDVEDWGWNVTAENTPQAAEVVAWMAQHGYCLDSPRADGQTTLLQSLLEHSLGGSGEMALMQALVDHGARIGHLDLERLAQRPHGVGDFAAALIARQHADDLENTTSPVTAQRAARRM